MITHPVLTQLAGTGMKLGLDTMHHFLAAIGDPHLAYPVVHVAGTNGKGSVCTMVTEALVAAGYRVGTNTSPHLEHVNERVRLDGVPVDDATLVAAIEGLDRLRTDWGRSLGLEDAPLTYFEFTTALAFQLFAARQVDVAVIEVGLGGRLDATNVVQPACTAITSIGLDHAEQLGDTLASVAAEKAGILKRGVPVVVGPMQPEAHAAIAARASALGLSPWWTGEHLTREPRGERWVLGTPEGTVGPVQLAMPGAHQGANAAVAVGVLHQLRRAGFAVSDDHILTGLSRAVVPGRLEVLRPGLIIDGAHNAAGSEALGAWLGSRPRPESRILLFGQGEGRDPMALLAPLLPHVDEVVLTRCAHPKALEPMQIAALLGDVPVTLSDGGPIEDCLLECVLEADEVVVAGSLYLAGAVRALVGEGLLDGM